MTPNVANASLAILSARTYLNDIGAITWSDPIIFAALQEAHRELSARLLSFGVDVVRETAAIISVPSVTVGPIPLPNLPSNLVIPLSMYERDPGDSPADFVLMEQRNFLPNIDLTTDLIYWSWMQGQILIPGATSPKEVQLNYRGSLSTPQTVNDSLGFNGAELYIGPRIASILNPTRTDLMLIAETNLDVIIRTNVVSDQGVPTRRIGYRRTGFRRRVW